MTAYAGVGKILRYNWPWYAGAVALTGLWAMVPATAWWSLPMLVAVSLGNGWLLLSLVVSHVIYDRSAIAHGGWLKGYAAAHVVVLHAGHDEASGPVRRLLPAAQVITFDVHDPQRRTSPSLRRARAEAAESAMVIPVDRIPLPGSATDLVLMIFAAHEIRDQGARVALFREVARIIGVSGRALVVEHQRDAWNLLAYGPGFAHFLSRRRWMRTFAQAGLQVARDDRFTPWVHRFELRATP